MFQKKNCIKKIYFTLLKAYITPFVLKKVKGNDVKTLINIPLHTF